METPPNKTFLITATPTADVAIAVQDCTTATPTATAATEEIITVLTFIELYLNIKKDKILAKNLFFQKKPCHKIMAR